MQPCQELRNEDLGVPWEHFVLNELLSAISASKIHYWRDKAGHEIDFIIQSNKVGVIAIECKRRAQAGVLNT